MFGVGVPSHQHGTAFAIVFGIVIAVTLPFAGFDAIMGWILLVIAAWFAVGLVLCLGAHWAVNRYSRPLESEPKPRPEPGEEYDLSRDWKPCGNPECRAPIPRESTKTYCDDLCRNTAREIEAHEHEREFRAKHPDYDEVPF